MCECGCGDVQRQFKLPAPNGRFYLFGIYPSCKDCETPAGVDIWDLGREEAERDWGIEVGAIPDLPMPHGGGALPVIDPLVLRRRMLEGGALWEGVNGDEVDAELLVEELIDGHFREAVWETIPGFKRPRQVRKICCINYVIPGRPEPYCRSCGIITRDERLMIWGRYAATPQAQGDLVRPRPRTA